MISLGERKRKLTSAVLSHQQRKKGKSSLDGDNHDFDFDEDDIGGIGRILQKSLSRNREKQDCDIHILKPSP